MTDLSTGRGFLLAILLFFAVIYGFVAIDMMCLNEGCPAYDVDLGDKP